MELTKVAKVLIAKKNGINCQNEKMDGLDDHIEGTIKGTYQFLNMNSKFQIK